MCDCMWLGFSKDVCISIFIVVIIVCLVFVAIVSLYKNCTLWEKEHDTRQATIDLREKNTKLRKEDLQFDRFIMQFNDRYENDNCWVIMYSTVYPDLLDEDFRFRVVSHLIYGGFKEVRIAPPCDLDSDYVLYAAAKNKGE